MRIKHKLKPVLGRLPLERLEQLTEYSILQQAPSTDLSRSRLLHTFAGPREWREVHQGRVDVWQKTLERIETPDILFLEFGVAWGESMREFIRLSPSERSLFFGFDSFEGLPEQWRATPKGGFSAGGQAPDIEDPRVRFVKGWFRDTLPPRREELLELARSRTVVVHFDADLYSSTLYLLFELARLFVSYCAIFDEFGGHEARAFYNFHQATGAEIEFLYHNVQGSLPSVVTGLLRMP